MDPFILAACAFTVLVMGAALYSFTRQNQRTLDRIHEAELRIVTDGRRTAAERAGAITTLEEQLAEARLAVAAAKEQACMARIYAMQAAESADGPITDRDPPRSERRNVVALRPVTQ